MTLFGGIQRKCLTVIGARTSEGKSTLAVQIAYDLAVQGKTVLFLSLETTIEKIGARLFCLHNRYNNTKAFRGGVVGEPQQWDKFEADLKELPLIINDMLGRSWEEIDKVITDCQLKPDVVIVDYIQTIANRDGQNKLETINEYIRRFRELAIRNDFAAILCSQVNRTIADEKVKEPQLHQLKGCIHGDSLVGEKTIKSIYEHKDYSNLKSFDGRSIVLAKPQHIIHSGRKRCLRIKTKSGKEIILSKNTHLFNGKKWVCKE